MVEEPTERSGFPCREPVVDHNDVPTGKHHGPLKTKQTQLGWIRARGIRRHNCDVAIGRNIRDLGTTGIGTGPAHTVRVLAPSIDQDRVVIPGLLLRLFYSPGKVAKDVKINLRGELPINPSLNSSVPHLDLYLEITNLSNLNLVLDRILLDLWFGQPVLQIGGFHSV